MSVYEILALIIAVAVLVVRILDYFDKKK